VSPVVKAILGLTVFIGGAATVAGYGPIASSHIGAPAPSLPCPPPYHLEESWYTDSQLARAEAGGKPPGGASVIHWLGYTELIGCGQSIAITTGGG
jgi:hypothetical protein